MRPTPLSTQLGATGLSRGLGFWIPWEENGRQRGPSRPRGPHPVLGEAQPTPVSRPVSWAAGAAQILPHPCLRALEARPEVGSPGWPALAVGGAQLAFPPGRCRGRSKHFPRCLVPPGSSSSNGPGRGEAGPRPRLLPPPMGFSVTHPHLHQFLPMDSSGGLGSPWDTTLE